MAANDDYLDALVRHQIGLLRLTGSIRNRIFAILDASEQDIQREIRRRARLNRNGTLSAARLGAMERSIRQIRGVAWQEVEQIWLDELRAVATSEPEFLAMAARIVSPVVLNTVLPEVGALRAIVDTRPFEGRVLRDWASNIQQTDLDRIMGQVRIGLVQGESSLQISRRVVGTARTRGVDGVTEITRRGAAAITRTAVNAISNEAKRAFYVANSDIIDEELYVATLDSRTTPICQSLDGERFPVGEGPIPPLHFACRSLRVAILDGEVLGRRPTKSSTDRMLLREYTASNGLPTVSSRGALPRGHRGAFDSFSRGRVRELTGTVPAKVNYETFLRRQTAAFQDDVLGTTKGRLFRRGGLSLDRFVNRQGDELNLSELVRNDKQAFINAGLDPEDFR